MRYYTVYIGLAQLAGPQTRSRSNSNSSKRCPPVAQGKARETHGAPRRLDVFCTAQQARDGALPGALVDTGSRGTATASPRPKQTQRQRQQRERERELSTWLQAADYRFGRVQIEWWDQCAAAELQPAQGMAPKQQPGPVGVFEASMACSCTYETGILRLYCDGDEHAEPELVQSPASADECITGGSGSGSRSAACETRPSTLAVLAVPGYMTPTDFLSFTGPFADSIKHVRVIRDSSPSRYMIVLELRSVAKADEFYAYYNGKTFSPLEPETCHVVYIRSVRCEVQEVGAEDIDRQGARVGDSPASLFLLPTSPTRADSEGGSTELPTCPVCLERLDSSTSGLLTTMCRHMFHCRCLARWGDGSCPVCRYTQVSAFVDHEKFQQTVAGPGAHPLPGSAAGGLGAPRDGSAAAAESNCGVCQRTNDLWMCLICGTVGCGRYANGHAKDHYEQTQHPYSMELVSQGVWDYAGDGYVHRLLQNMADRKVIALEPHRSQGGDTGRHGLRAGSEDAVHRGGSPSPEGSGGSKAARRQWIPSHGGLGSLVDAREKHEAVTKEYEALLVSQLESQRDYYEMQLARQNHQLAQQSTRRAELERAHNEMQQRCVGLEREQAQHSRERSEDMAKRLARADEERKEWSSERKRLEAASTKWLKKSTEDARLLLEERAMSRQLADNYKAQQDQITDLKASLADLEDQVRDLTFFISTQKALAADSNADSELHGASVVGVAEPKPPARTGKGRRRK
ncbi:hypothetical protein H4R19_001978 [Coemansia spiralis]|nr:hypothetical protein H4R19_001978 [Coemansia spiralis]